MSRAQFRRPDGREGSYGEWAQSRASLWASLTASEQKAHREAAAERLVASVKAEAGGPTQLHLMDEIGWFGVWAPDVISALKNIKGDVEVRLNSPGGDVFDALAIYSALREHPGQVGVVVDGLAASAASFIAQAASPGGLEMAPNGTMMIHDAWTLTAGNEDDHLASAKILAQQSENIASIYAERAGRSAAEMRDLMRAETWAVGQEAVDLRLADRVRQPPAADAAPSPGPPPSLAPAAAWQVTILTAVDETPRDDGGDMNDHAGMPAWLANALTVKEAANR